MLTPQEIRNTFINFFKERQHTVVPSAPLTPKGDPTLLFTSAGMVRFKKLWSGEVPLPYKRAVTVQKCLRASDLENVGHSIRYNTFFEMLGNFSFGDYFKREAIKWSWEFLTEVLKLPQEKLCVSVLEEDDEAYKIWRKEVKLPENKIYKLGKEDNFWSPVGGQGACGPCSEIFYDMSKEVGCGKKTCAPGCDCDRFPEIWNLVFPQYDLQPDGTLKPLKNRGIDTGMGFERLVMVTEDKKSIFETSLFMPLIEETAKICNLKYEEHKTALSIIADHIRALTFALAEGIYPSNIGRGYLLRRILRRAQREAYEAGIKKPFLYKLVGVVVNVMREQYPELVGRCENVALIVKSEEESFLHTIDQGSAVFNQILASLKGRPKIAGKDVFKLYDTYGFPLELTEELAKRKGLEIDKEEFRKVMDAARQRTKEKAKFKDTGGKWQELLKCEKTGFLGYEALSSPARIAKWRQTEDKIEVIVDKTPFYAETGGQVGDRGKIYNDKIEIEITNTQWLEEFVVHIGKLKKGAISDREVVCEVNQERREAIKRNHTGTHLLHAALRKILGDHVHQEGSFVEAERFRFDFTHFKPLDEYELEKIEATVNEWIQTNTPVKTEIMPFETAIKTGAMAIFGEKYGDRVRVVKIDNISMELCGGIHVSSTNEVEKLGIISETGIHAGVRRMEIVTGNYADLYFQKEIADLLDQLKTEKSQINKLINKLSSLGEKTPFASAQDDYEKETEKLTVSRYREKIKELTKLLEENKSRTKKLKDKLRSLEQKSALASIDDIIKNKQKLKVIEVLAAEPAVDDIGSLRLLADKLRAAEHRAGILQIEKESKPVYIIFVSDDEKSKLKASDLAKEWGKFRGGGGGGKDTLAQAGGKERQDLSATQSQFVKLVQKIHPDE